jgi:hypothetical protein
MPLTLGERGNSKTDPFLWGLLPENEKVLDQWGKGKSGRAWSLQSRPYGMARDVVLIYPAFS